MWLAVSRALSFIGRGHHEAAREQLRDAKRRATQHITERKTGVGERSFWGDISGGHGLLCGDILMCSVKLGVIEVADEFPACDGWGSSSYLRRALQG
jgi:hypothetical protein